MEFNDEELEVIRWALAKYTNLNLVPAVRGRTRKILNRIELHRAGIEA